MGQQIQNDNTDKWGREVRRISLTRSDNGGTSNAGLDRSTAESEEIAEPAESELLSVAIKVRRQATSLYEEFLLLAEGWVADGQRGFDPARAGGDGAAVYEDVEAGLATVGAAATLAHTAEFESGDVQRSVVDGDTSGAGLGENYSKERLTCVTG